MQNKAKQTLKYLITLIFKIDIITLKTCGSFFSRGYVVIARNINCGCTILLSKKWNETGITKGLIRYINLIFGKKMKKKY